MDAIKRLIRSPSEEAAPTFHSPRAVFGKNDVAPHKKIQLGKSGPRPLPLTGQNIPQIPNIRARRSQKSQNILEKLFTSFSGLTIQKLKVQNYLFLSNEPQSVVLVRVQIGKLVDATNKYDRVSKSMIIILLSFFLHISSI